MSTETVQFKSFVGVDLHQCTVTLRAVDPAGTLIASVKFDTKCVNAIHEWLLKRPRPSWMAVEACPFLEWFIDRYRSCVDRIDIADATELARRRGKRRYSDRNCALDLAQRLARGEAPLGWIADEDTVHLRKLGRHWHQLSRILGRAKQSMKSILHAANVRGPQFDGASAQRWLLAHGKCLKDVDARHFAHFLDLILLLERQRENLRREIVLANRSAAFQHVTSLLKTVPGIDEIWACIIAAEIDVFSRFPNADTLEFWAGLTADNKESAGKSRSGAITKAGSRTLRWALGKAACCLAQHDRSQAQTKRRLLKNCGNVKPKANVAMARRLLRILYAMIRDGTEYQNIEPMNHLAQANRARPQKRQACPVTP